MSLFIGGKRESSERFDGFWKTVINSSWRLDKDCSEAGDASRFTLLGRHDCLYETPSQWAPQMMCYGRPDQWTQHTQNTHTKETKPSCNVLQ